MIKQALFIILNTLAIFCTGTTTAQNTKKSKNVNQNDTIKAQYPGGIDGWRRYLERNLNGDLLVKNAAPTGKYIVSVKLMIDTAGNLVAISAQNDPGYGTAQEVVRVITKSGKWIPATWHGKAINDEVIKTVTFLADSALNKDNAKTKNLSRLSKKERDSAFRARDVLRIKESVGVNDATADSMLAIMKAFGDKIIPAFYLDTAALYDEKYLSLNILMLEKEQRIKKILTDEQYQKWLNMHMYHMNEPINKTFLQHILENNLPKAKVKMYKDSLQLSNIQSDSLTAIDNRFKINVKKAKLDSTTTKKEQLEELLILLHQKNSSVKANLTAVQFKKWQQLEIIDGKRKPVAKK